MIPLPPPRDEPYGLPEAVSLEPAYLLRLLGPELPGLVSQAIDWAAVRRLTRRLTLTRTYRPDGVHVCLGEAPDTLEATCYVPWTELRAVLMVAGARLGPTARMALALVCAWQDPKWRAELDRRGWMRELADLVDTTSGENQGHVRATLKTAPLHRESATGIGGALFLSIVRYHKVTGAPLTPRALESERDLEAYLPTATPAERALARRFEHRLMAKHYTYGTTGALQAIDTLIFEALPTLKEVWVDDQPARASAEPWSATLRLEDAPEGGVRLVWSGRHRHIWALGDRAWVLDDEGCVRPLAPALVPVVRLLSGDLPTIPEADVPLLLSQVLQRTRVPVDLQSRHTQPKPGAPEPHLVLSLVGDQLHLAVRFTYAGTPVSDHALVPTPEGVYTRDLQAESALLGEAEALLDGALPQLKLGTAAWDFLADDLPLFEGWIIDVDRDLLPKVRGGLRPRITFESGLDWFGLAVDLEVEGLVVPVKRAIEAWRAGSQWVNLPDGSRARLPAAWLERHAEAVQELSEAGRLHQGQRRLGLAQAWAAEDLLSQAEANAGLLHWQERLGEIRRKIRDFSGLATHEVPASVRAELRPYQRFGFQWLASLAELGLGGVLADDMGLGKTLQALAWLQHEVERRPDGGPSLVVAPTSVIHNWISEAARFTPKLRVHLHHGSGRGRLPEDVDLVVTSYALLTLDGALASRRWRAVVLDEAQQIKNALSARAQVAHRLAADHRFCLTGTPLENNLGELWSLFEFAVPGLFGSFKGFMDAYARPIQAGDAERMARLRGRIRPFVLRRLKSEVAAELPPRTEQVLICTLGKAQRVLYESIREAYRERVLAAVAQRGVGGATLQVLEALTRMRQACCDPSLVPLPQARLAKSSAKREILRELFENLVAEGRRALVFSQWPSFLALIRKDLEGAGHPYLYLDGQTTERAHLEARWNQPDGPPFFLISIKAGGAGLNLTGADMVIHLDPWWNPAVEDQATDRAHRIGQTRPVLVYKLVCQGTVEEKLIELQARKRALFNATVNEERLLADSLTRADLEAVFRGGSVEEAPEEEPDPGVRTKAGPAARGRPKATSRAAKARLPPTLEAAFAQTSGLTLAEVAAALGRDPQATRTWLAAQIAAGHLRREGRTRATRYFKVSAHTTS